jgi:transketolase
MSELVDPIGDALARYGNDEPELVVVDGLGDPSPSAAAFQAAFPDRHTTLGPAQHSPVEHALARASEGRPVVVLDSAARIAGRGYADLRHALALGRPRLRLLATIDARPWSPSAVPMAEDIGLMRGLPGMTVVCPADARHAASALNALEGLEGPVYLRLAPGGASVAPAAGRFELGRAPTLREGRDLTIGAIGSAIAPALAVAQALSRVGLEARVLDLASVKPIDEKAIVRAARETGAILTLEEHSVLTGVGSAVAAITAEECPVPVRRLGFPDLFPTGAASATPSGEDPLAVDAVLEAAYELLRARGKVQ